MEKVNEQQAIGENQKRLLQQALDMLEEQALHIEAPMLPAGEELLNRIRAAISQQAEPCEQAPEQDERQEAPHIPLSVGVDATKDGAHVCIIVKGYGDVLHVIHSHFYAARQDGTQVVASVAAPIAQTAPTPWQEATGRAAFKNFHRSLCDRFGYTHDEEFWWRDLISLEEHIAQQSAPDRVRVPVELLQSMYDATPGAWWAEQLRTLLASNAESRKANP